MKDQSAKLAVLDKIIEMLDGIDAQKLGPKAPDATIIDVKAAGLPEGSPEEEAKESPAEESAEAKLPGGDEDDDELMEKLRQKYAGLK